MCYIQHVRAREVFDSRGNPTVEVGIVAEKGIRGRGIAPAGASRGRSEAVEIRDPDRFCGKGVSQAVGIVHELVAPALQGRLVTEQAELDQVLMDLDGTPNRSRLGGNVMLATSVAIAQVVAAQRGIALYESFMQDAIKAGLRWQGSNKPSFRLPVPMVNMISGGLHAGLRMEVQDFLIIPRSARTFSQAMEMTYMVHRKLRELLRAKGYEADLVADEGGYAPRFSRSEEAIEHILEAIRRTGLSEGRDVFLAIDVAASHFYQGGRYKLVSQGRDLDNIGLVEYLSSWIKSYPIASLEDPLAEQDWTGWQIITERWGQQIQIIGDDLFATNPGRLRDGISQGIANAILIKPNQVGTITETFKVMTLAQRAGYRMILSARSGETEESWLADLAVGTGVGQIKIGCITRSERLAKYNQLLRIADELGDNAWLACLDWLPRPS